MESTPGPAHGLGGRRDLAADPVKAQGILRSVVQKERAAAKQWQEKWSFYTHVREIQEEEAQKLGMSVEAYRAAVWSVSSQPAPQLYAGELRASPGPLPQTSSGTIGRRALCPLERYGRLVPTGADLPLRPPLPPGQIYDPYKQTIIFLGIDVGDPISYKLPREAAEVSADVWSRTQQLAVAPLHACTEVD